MNGARRRAWRPILEGESAARALETARLGLRMTEEVRDEFLEKLGALWEEYRVRSDAEQTGPAWSLFFAMHPDPNYPDLT